MKMKLLRTTSSNPDFMQLCLNLDSELNARYGKSQSKYDEHNVIKEIQTVIVCYHSGIPIAGGCFKAMSEESIEIKRMYVKPEHRRKGVSTQVLTALERWAKEHGFVIAKLETGKGQPEAVSLYKKQGYAVTENYGPYRGLENSICMMKRI
jgi:GNAT superfamily N-acetyltransferase